MDRRVLAAAVACVLFSAACLPASSGTPRPETPNPSAGTGVGSSARAPGSTVADPTVVASPSESPTPSPVDVVQAFYDWYLQGHEVEAVVARSELSPALADYVRGFEGTQDPFLCSELHPTDLRAVTASSSGGTAIVSTVVSHGAASEEPGPAVDLVLSDDGRWQLEFIGCQP